MNTAPEKEKAMTITPVTTEAARTFDYEAFEAEKVYRVQRAMLPEDWTARHEIQGELNARLEAKHEAPHRAALEGLTISEKVAYLRRKNPPLRIQNEIVAEAVADIEAVQPDHLLAALNSATSVTSDAHFIVSREQARRRPARVWS